MRNLILIGMFAATALAAPGARACDPRGGGGGVEVVIVTPSPAATQQSQTFLTVAASLEIKATTEESAASAASFTAKNLRRKASSIRVQAAQVSGPSQSGLIARAEKLEAEAAVSDASSATFTARAKIIRARAGALRKLSAHVLANGPVTSQVLARVTLPAAPSGHPDKTPLKTLDAVPSVATSMIAARI